MYHLLESVFASKELYQTVLTPVCEKYDLSHAELVTLLYLGGDMPGDTATDIVKKLRMHKSVVSASVRALQEKGLVVGEHTDGNHRTVHLTLCSPAKEIVEDGLSAQQRFFEIVTDGFSEEELAHLKASFVRMSSNITSYQKSAIKK